MDDLLTVEVEASALAGIHATLEKLCEEVAGLESMQHWKSCVRR
jgi:hypothetical protein